jgi:parallel beta-helix repeat protein
MSTYINTIIKFVLFVLVIFVSDNTFAQSNNNSYVFDGESGYAGILDDETLSSISDKSAYQYFDNPSFTNESISVEAWVYLIGENPGVSMPIIYRSTGDNYETFSLYIKDRVAYFSIGNGTSVVSSINADPIQAFRWVHLVGTFDGQQLKLYYNGDLTQTITAELGSGSAAEGGLFLGKSDEGAFKGLIDEIRIWNIALGENNINSSGGNGNPSENYPQSLDEYLNGRWSFTEFSYFNGVKSLEDLSDNNNHLKVYDIDEIVNSKSLPFIVVNSTGDLPDLLPGDGLADAGNGQVTLRSAIQETNALAGFQIIYFYIPGAAPHTIQPGTTLPDITDPVFLNGTLQSGYTGTPLVETSGNFGGISINSGVTTIDGLSLNSTSGYALTLSTNGRNTIHNNQISGLSIQSSENIIDDNFITNSIADGINISSGAENNLVGTISPNIISGNAGKGLSIVNANGNQVTGNSISSNASDGISISNSAGILSNNLISDNTGIGLVISSSTGFEITNNDISTNVAGGISVAGGTMSLVGNTVTGNSEFGLSINASNTSITENEISGNSGGSNTVNGLNLIGNNNSVSQNDVSGNSGHGILINGTNNKVTDSNTINQNGMSGLYVESGNDNSILNNSIFDNAGLGIELAESANSGHAIPSLNLLYAWVDDSNPSGTKGGIYIEGNIDGAPDEIHRVQLFANSPTTNREGKRFLAELDVSTDFTGDAEIIANLKDVILNSGEVVSATATILGGNGETLSTSEFSGSVARETAEGDHYIVNTTLNGIPLHWKDGEGDYNIAPSISGDYKTAVQNGFATWSGLEQINYQAGPPSTSENWGGNADGINNVVWIPTTGAWESITGAPTNVVAVTRVRYNALNGKMVDIDIACNGQPISLNTLDPFTWDTQGDISSLDVQNVATHEIGHYSGLGDLYNPGDFNYTPEMTYNNQEATMYGRIF